MSGRRNKQSNLISAAVFIVLEIAAIGLLRTSSSLQNVWVNRASHRFCGWFWAGGEQIRSFVALRSNNERLARENAQLLQEVSAYREAGLGRGEAISHANRRYTYTPAKVVKMSRNLQQNYIMLDKGSADGVEPMSGIVTTEGVVGIVNATSEHYSYGMLLLNAGMSVSARIGRSGVVAPLVWDGRSTREAQIQGVPLTVSVSRTDTIWTSGHSTVFPADIPIGIPTRKTTNNGASDNVEVELFLDLSNIDYVYIVKNNDDAEMAALEKEQQPKDKKKKKR